MLNSIQRNSRFQEDYQRYNAALSEMPEGQLKEDTRKLLNSLVGEVRKLDNMHTEMVYNKQLSGSGSDVRDTILSIRKQLEKKLADWDASRKNV